MAVYTYGNGRLLDFLKCRSYNVIVVYYGKY